VEARYFAAAGVEERTILFSQKKSIGMRRSSAASEPMISCPNTMSGRIIENRARPPAKMSTSERPSAEACFRTFVEATRRKIPRPT